ncbi:MAG: class I SAM-dependent methyltransferase [Candidatus Wallbacteria bacterium]|nr:class I SAM-dependent methyltransferase [Candidatus Wallbacteria bacterium]
MTYESEERHDVLVLSEVLEHLQQPLETLNHLHSLLRPGALLVLTVPNGYGPWEAMNCGKKLLGTVGLGGPLLAFQRLFGFGKATLQSRNPHLDHVQFFTQRALRELVERAGFEARAVRNLSFVAAVFPFSWAFRRAPGIEAADSAIASFVPRWLASGWLLELLAR